MVDRSRSSTTDDVDIFKAGVYHLCLLPRRNGKILPG